MAANKLTAEIHASLTELYGSVEAALADCSASIRLKSGVPDAYRIRVQACDALGEKVLADRDRKHLNEMSKDAF